MGKCATVYLLDASVSMGLSPPPSEPGDRPESHLNTARAMIADLLHDKYVSNRKTDQVGLVAYGVEETNNQLADSDGMDYQHVSVLHDIDKAEIALLQNMARLQPHAELQGDGIDGLVVAVDLIARHCRHLKFEKKVYWFTDAKSPMNSTGLSQIADKIKADNVQITLVGMSFKDEDEEDEEDEDGEKEKSDKESAQDEPDDNEKLLKHLMRNLLAGTNSEAYSAAEASSFFSQVRKRSVNPTTLFRGPLTFGGSCQDDSTMEPFSIPVVVYSRTMQLKLPSAKKVLVTDSNEQVDVKRQFNRVVADDDDDAAGDGQEQPAPSTTSVRHDELSKLFAYGASSVPLMPTEEASMALSTVKSMDIVGFYPSVQRHHFLSNVLAVLAQPGSDRAQQLFSVFITALYEAGVVAAVRYVRINNATPKIGVLIPAVKMDKYQCCYFAPLPYEDDVRRYPFASLPVGRQSGNASRRQAPTAQQLDATSRFIMQNQLVHDTEDGAEELYKPNHIFNPIYHHLYACIRERIIHPDGATPPPAKKRLITPLEPQTTVNADNVKFSSMFQLKVQTSKKKSADSEAAASQKDVQLSLDDLLSQSTINIGAELAEFRDLQSAGTMSPLELMERYSVRVCKAAASTTDAVSTAKMVQGLRKMCQLNGLESQFNAMWGELSALNGDGRVNGDVWRALCDEHKGEL